MTTKPARRYRNERVEFVDFLNRSRPPDSDYALDSFQNPAERFGIADDGNSNSADLQVILERADPAKNVARYYVLSIEATLFARNTLVRIGSAGRQRRSLRRRGLRRVGAEVVVGEKA